MKFKKLPLFLLLVIMLTGFSIITYGENTSSIARNSQASNHDNDIAPLQAGTNVLIIKDVDPWLYPANEEALQELWVSYDIINSADLAIADLSQYDIIIIPSNQYTSTYNNLIANRDKLAQWVANGGTLVVHACDMAFPNYGHWSQSFLPGGVNHQHYYYNSLLIIDPTHPVVQGLSNSDISGWGYSTHGFFIGLPANVNVIIETLTHFPTYIEYSYGSGLVLATMQRIELPWRYEMETWKNLLRNELSYVLGEEITWEYIFEDARRGTILRVSTDDMLFQFLAPGKDYGIMQAQKMRIRDIRRGGQYIRIYHTEDTDDNGRPDLRFYARINTRVDRCFAILRDLDARRTYVLLDRPGIE
jgi:hypothetical protein